MNTDGLQQANEHKHRSLHSWMRWLLPTHPYSWSSSFLYLLELIFGGAWLVKTSAWWLLPVFIIAILALFVLDRFEYQRYGEKTPERIAFLLLVARFVCVELAILIAPGLTPILYLLFPFRAMFYFGHKAAYGITALILIRYFSLFWFDARASHDSIGIIFAFIFCIACIWTVSMARMITLERESQRREHMLRIHTEELLEEVKRSHHQLRIYTEQVAALATIEERNRVAREIHDSLGHSLIAISLQLEKALVYHAAHPQEALQAVDDARMVAKAALQDVRRSVQALHTDAEPFSCLQEIMILVEQLRKNGLLVDFVFEGNERTFPRQTLITLYRIAQECFTNIQKHAQARNIQVRLRFDAEQADLDISDNGIGFDVIAHLEQRAEQEESFGLQGMHERLHLIGGTLQLNSSPGQGTQLIASVKRQNSILSSPGYNLNLEDSRSGEN